MPPVAAVVAHAAAAAAVDREITALQDGVVRDRHATRRQAAAAATRPARELRPAVEPELGARSPWGGRHAVLHPLHPLTRRQQQKQLRLDRWQVRSSAWETQS